MITTKHYHKNRKGDIYECKSKNCLLEPAVFSEQLSKHIKEKRQEPIYMARKSPPRKREPIYEKLEPNSCLIISKSEKDVIYACNVKGEIKLRRASVPKDTS